MLLSFFKVLTHAFLTRKLHVAVSTFLIGCVILILIFLKYVQAYSAYRGIFYDSFYKRVYKVLTIFFIVILALNGVLNVPFFDGIAKIVSLENLDRAQGMTIGIQLIFNYVCLVVSTISFVFWLVIEYKYD